MIIKKQMVKVLILGILEDAEIEFENGIQILEELIKDMKKIEEITNKKGELKK